MARNRFKAILSNLHLNDNSTYILKSQSEHCPTHKIRPILDHFLLESQKTFYPSENLTIDEGMCGFHGRIVFRVYIKNKPDKYGTKMFIVCNSKTGYVLRLEVYAGKGTQDNSILPLFERLLADYLGKGHTVYRFYSSPAVFDFLWQHKMKAVGTCMTNWKELPNEIVSKKLKRVESMSMRRNHQLCLKWKDTRDVLFLSTVHEITISDTSVHTKEGIKVKSNPDAILDYNIYKTGVDRSDQMISYYAFRRKQMKWWKKLFFHMLITAATNAFVLYRETRTPAQRKSCTNLALDNVPSETHSNRLLGRHFAEKIPVTEKKECPTRVCKVCSEETKKQENVAKQVGRKPVGGVQTTMYHSGFQNASKSSTLKLITCEFTQN
ncbi:piggyBac transposable element-derived protein 4-like [Schistocerca serialis cubense]|uniref:piggyBac transposable element-derived protein 4-like n=1 Tax=Schistocerca serialis cubense TaxID=2023355 RepID=UPI00214EA5DD|nr:piggyBac transposable element-derived protein 4-like [Schistocerca serialis cubense]